MKTISTTMTAEMSAFVCKFNSLLLAGLKAKLVMECEEGVVRAHVEAMLGPAGAAHDAPAGRHHPHQARAGPARLRRRARRAEANANVGRQASQTHLSSVDRLEAPPPAARAGRPPSSAARAGPPPPPAGN